MEDQSNRQSNYKDRSHHRPKCKEDIYDVFQMVEDDFSKKINLKGSHNRWKLPHYKEFFTSDEWKLDEMMRVKYELNNKKNELSKFNIKDWRQHTRKNNHAGDVIFTIKKRIHAEFVTQAWCKFYEIVSSYNLVCYSAVESGKLNSLHLCEAPGAFVTSLNHFLKTRFPLLNWTWRASTLNPYYEGNSLSYMINDDRFILHTMDSWDFGNDQTGDIFKLENIQRLISVAQQTMSPIFLVTADGSIDCQSDPGEQESIVSKLHYFETLVALSVLHKGGSFVLKMFTMFECDTICLMYLLSCIFESVEFCKPATSKEGNSEVYVICLDYCGPSAVAHYLELLKYHILENTGKIMFALSQLPKDFIRSIVKCATFFKTYQISTIQRNIDTFDSGNSDEFNYKIMKIRRKLAASYLERYSLECLPFHDDYIVGNDVLRNTVALNLDPRNEEMACGHESNDVWVIVGNLKKLLHSTSFKWSYDGQVISFNSEQLFKVMGSEILKICGKPITVVNSSKFCLGSLIQTWNKVGEIKLSMVCINSISQPIANIILRVVEIIPDLRFKKYATCDLSSVKYDENVYLFEKLLTNNLFHSLKFMDWGENLLLIGVPLLTRCTVGLIYLTSLLFNEIRFVNPTDVGYVIVFLCRENNAHNNQILSALEEIINQSNHNQSSALHSIINVSKLVEDHTWYRCILEINNVHMYIKISERVKELLTILNN